MSVESHCEAAWTCEEVRLLVKSVTYLTANRNRNIRKRHSPRFQDRKGVWTLGTRLERCPAL